MTYILFPEEQRAHLLLGFRSAAIPNSKTSTGVPNLSVCWTVSSIAEVIEFEREHESKYLDIYANPQNYTVLTYQEPEKKGSIVISKPFNEFADAIAKDTIIRINKDQIAVPSYFIERTI